MLLSSVLCVGFKADASVVHHLSNAPHLICDKASISGAHSTSVVYSDCNNGRQEMTYLDFTTMPPRFCLSHTKLLRPVNNTLLASLPQDTITRTNNLRPINRWLTALSSRSPCQRNQPHCWPNAERTVMFCVTSHNGYCFTEEFIGNWSTSP